MSYSFGNGSLSVGCSLKLIVFSNESVHWQEYVKDRTFTKRFLPILFAPFAYCLFNYMKSINMARLFWCVIFTFMNNQTIDDDKWAWIKNREIVKYIRRGVTIVLTLDLRLISAPPHPSPSNLKKRLWIWGWLLQPHPLPTMEIWSWH